MTDRASTTCPERHRREEQRRTRRLYVPEACIERDREDRVEDEAEQREIRNVAPIDAKQVAPEEQQSEKDDRRTLTEAHEGQRERRHVTHRDSDRDDRGAEERGRECGSGIRGGKSRRAHRGIRQASFWYFTPCSCNCVKRNDH